MFGINCTRINQSQPRNISLYIITGVIYRCLDADVTLSNDYLDKTLGLLNKTNKLTYLIGDFNVNLLNMENNAITSDFFQIMTSYFYCPIIFQPTRIISYTATLVDNCFMNNYEHSTVSGILITDISDHSPIFHISDLKVRNPTPNNRYFFLG